MLASSLVSKGKQFARAGHQPAALLSTRSLPSITLPCLRSGTGFSKVRWLQFAGGSAGSGGIPKDQRHGCAGICAASFHKWLTDMGVDYLHSDIDAFWLGFYMMRSNAQTRKLYPLHQVQTLLCSRPKWAQYPAVGKGNQLAGLWH